MSHNKKRNTGFVYEALVKELTKAIVIEKDQNKQVVIREMFKKYFHPNKPLGRELQLYNAMQELDGIDNVEKYINEVKSEYRSMDFTKLEQEHSRLINDINKKVSNTVFNNYVSNYKALATISQIFSPKTPIKERMILEETFIKENKKPQKSTDLMENVNVDSAMYNQYIDKFNKLYGENLLSEQKSLLSKYISSFADEGQYDFKMFVNEEISRLIENVEKIKQKEEIKNNEELLQNTIRVEGFLKSISKQELNEEVIKKLLKIQQLCREFIND